MSDQSPTAYTAEQSRIDAALAILREHGIDIAAPWEGSLDDLERERFEAFTAALRSYGKACRDEGEEAVLSFVANGRFLHDEAPTAQFAREVVAGWRSLKSSSQPIQDKP